jgi:hypothetical protein
LENRKSTRNQSVRWSRVYGSLLDWDCSKCQPRKSRRARESITFPAFSPVFRFPPVILQLVIYSRLVPFPFSFLPLVTSFIDLHLLPPPPPLPFPPRFNYFHRIDTPSLPSHCSCFRSCPSPPLSISPTPSPTKSNDNPKQNGDPFFGPCRKLETTTRSTP